MFFVSAVSLVVIMVCCAAGAFSPKRLFDDNPLQRIGMGGVFFFCLGRFWVLMERGEIVGNCLPVQAQLAGHVGLALYSLGTAYKVWKHNAKLGKRKPPVPPPINEKHLHGVIGGSK